MSSDELEAGNWVGRFIDNYRVTGLAHSDGIVHSLTGEPAEAGSGQTVLIRLFDFETGGPAAVDLFDLERSQLQRLNHPVITRLMRTSRLADGSPYIVYEHTNAPDIIEFANARGLDLRGILRELLDALRALAYAHANGVAHGDLHTGQVRLLAPGKQKLAGFSITKVLGRLTNEYLPAGGRSETAFLPRIPAPEVFAGARANAASDIYQVGWLLFALVKPGDLPPFENRDTHLDPDDAARLRENHLSRQRRGRGADLQAIIAKATAPELSERYADLDELIHDLENYVEHLPVSAYGNRPFYRLSKWLIRQRSLVALGTLALIVTTIGTLIANSLLREQTRLAEEEARRATAVSAFLENTLASLDPLKHGGTPPSTEALIENAGQKLLDDQTLPDKVRLKLAATLAQAYFDLGRTETAAQILGNEISRYSDTEDFSSLNARLLHADILLGSSESQHGKGNPDVAAAALEQTESLLQTAPLSKAQRHLLTGRLWAMRGKIAVANIDADVLRESVAKASTELDALLTNRDIELARAWRMIGDGYRRLRDYPSAITAYKKAIDSFPAVPGHDAFRGILLSSLTAALTLSGDAEAALMTSTEALKLVREELPKNIDYLARALENRYAALAAAEELDAALAIIDETIQLLDNSGRRNHPVAIFAYLRRGELLQRSGTCEGVIESIDEGTRRLHSITQRAHGLPRAIQTAYDICKKEPPVAGKLAG